MRAVAAPVIQLDASRADGHNESREQRRARGACALMPLRETLTDTSAMLLASPTLHSLAQGIAWLAVILFMTAVGVATARKFRGGDAENHLSADELLTKFRDLHSRGGLSDEEYRTIKTKLAGQLQTELKDNENTS